MLFFGVSSIQEYSLDALCDFANTWIAHDFNFCDKTWAFGHQQSHDIEPALMISYLDACPFKSWLPIGTQIFSVINVPTLLLREPDDARTKHMQPGKRLDKVMYGKIAPTCKSLTLLVSQH